MNDEQRRRSERLSRAHDYGLSHTADFPATSKGGAAIASLGQIIANINNLDASRSTARRYARQGTDAKKTAIENLRRSLKAISRTAATMTLDLPELKNKFRAPAYDLNRQDLLALARSFVTEATPLKAKFIDYEMDADFLTDLNNQINAFDEADTQQNSHINSSAENRAALDAQLDAGEEELARLDTSVRNKFASDAAALAAWDSARHLEKAPRKSKQSKSAGDRNNAPAGNVKPS
jgi:hypothetical protein